MAPTSWLTGSRLHPNDRDLSCTATSVSPLLYRQAAAQSQIVMEESAGWKCGLGQGSYVWLMLRLSGYSLSMVGASFIVTLEVIQTCEVEWMHIPMHVNHAFKLDATEGELVKS